MTLLFDELDRQPSPIGDISLRRRRIPVLGDRDIYEVKLGEEFLMSSAFVDGEIALAQLALDMLPENDLRVVVGGLGLGYTARAVLDCERVAELTVVEALETVIHWHHSGLVPLGPSLSSDPRCQFVLGDFFALAVDQLKDFRPGRPSREWDGILLDIDHSPKSLLNPRSAEFYTIASLTRMKEHLREGGVFAMWSNEPEDADFMSVLSNVFASVENRRVEFDNPFQSAKAFNTIYLARG